MFKGILIGIGLSIGLTIGGAVALGSLVYVGAHALDEAGRESLDNMKAEMRGQSKADFVVDACNERLDVTFAECINEYFPD